MKAVLSAIFSMMFVLCFLGCNKSGDVISKNNLRDITSLEEFQSATQEGISVVFFHAVWCSRCKAQRPAVEGLVEMEDFSQVKFLEVDYEKVRSVADAMNVVGFPTILMLRNGQEVERFLGQGHTQSQLEGRLRSLL